VKAILEVKSLAACFNVTLVFQICVRLYLPTSRQRQLVSRFSLDSYITSLHYESFLAQAEEDANLTRSYTMARLRSIHPPGRHPNVHFSLSKMSDPPSAVKTTATSPLNDRVTKTSSIFRAPQAMLSELVHHERVKTRPSKRTPPRDVLAPKHAGIRKSERRTPLSVRSDRNTKILPKSLGSSGKRSSKRRQTRIRTPRPDHPLFRHYEGVSNPEHRQDLKLTWTDSCNRHLPETRLHRPSRETRQGQRINR